MKFLIDDTLESKYSKAVVLDLLCIAAPFLRLRTILRHPQLQFTCKFTLGSTITLGFHTNQVRQSDKRNRTPNETLSPAEIGQVLSFFEYQVHKLAAPLEFFAIPKGSALPRLRTTAVGPRYRITRPSISCFVNRTNFIRNIRGLVIRTNSVKSQRLF